MNSDCDWEIVPIPPRALAGSLRPAPVRIDRLLCLPIAGRMETASLRWLNLSSAVRCVRARDMSQG